ncbi:MULTISPECIES: type II toxin-antitoxin system Phd/YefM family antitoxin [unclassified Rhizobium]|uniref:type II toxin-antitoxin system Phd/YefM family antitoxin n=1 Tax=Rhizobium sp. Rhizsp42 TaxID=3243034 RepID=UPI000648E823
MTVISSREFHRKRRSDVFRAAAQEPLIITRRGQPAYVLMSVETYEATVKAKRPSLIEAFSVPGAEDIEFEIPKFDDTGIKPGEFDVSD